MTWIVFSRNRTFQLDACLSTMVANGGVDPKDVVVLHRYDDDLTHDFDRLRSYHPDVSFVKEEAFRDQVLQLVSSGTPEVSFATDDALVTRPIDREVIKSCLFQERTVLTYSCRLGFNIDYCYPLNVRQPRPPGLTDELSGTFFFPWKGVDHDWNYPLSLDGHFYKRDLLLRLLPRLDFRNPNTMESVMAQSARSIPIDVVACPMTSSYFNVPVNVVQQEFANRHGSVPVDALNERFRNGERFDPQKIRGYMNKSPHEEVTL